MTDDYELMPAVELDKLRKEIEILKANPFGTNKGGKSMQESIDSLTAAINKLVQVFSSVDEELLEEAQTMKSSQEHFTDIKVQNEKIAAGIVKVVDMMQEQKDVREAPAPIAGPVEAPVQAPEIPEQPVPAEQVAAPMPEPQAEPAPDQLLFQNLPQQAPTAPPVEQQFQAPSDPFSQPVDQAPGAQPFQVPPVEPQVPGQAPPQDPFAPQQGGEFTPPPLGDLGELDTKSQGQAAPQSIPEAPEKKKGLFGLFK